MQEKKTISGHVADLKKHLIRVAIISLLCFFSCLYFTKNIFAFLTNIGGVENMKFIFTSPEGGFILLVSVALNVCIIILLPFFLLEGLLFASPAIENKKTIYTIYAVSTALYFASQIISLKILIPLFVKFLTSIEFEGVDFYITTQNYIAFITKVSLSIGVVFQLPIVLILLVKSGIVPIKFLKEKRKHAFIFCFILSALLTPPDVLSQIIVGLMLYIFYEIVILVCTIGILPNKNLDNKKNDFTLG